MVVKTIAAFQSARYMLLFEVWEYLKPIAIKRRLVRSDITRKNYLELLIEQTYEIELEDFNRTGKRPTKRTLYRETNEAFKENKKALEPDLLSPVQLTVLQASMNEDLVAMSPLQRLLIEVACDWEEKDVVVGNATQSCRRTLQAALEAIKLFSHHKNKTR